MSLTPEEGGRAKRRANLTDAGAGGSVVAAAEAMFHAAVGAVSAVEATAAAAAAEAAKPN
jgi:hypothetical protein